jgi:hypothetical protein
MRCARTSVSVSDDDERAGAVGVRMGVLVGGSPVGGPAGVADPDAAGHRPLAQDTLQDLHPPRGAPHLQPAAGADHGHAGRIISAILQPLEPVDDDPDRALLSDVADDSAHGGAPLLVV